MASHQDGTLYIGVTSNPVKRIYEHRENLVDGFTKTHGVHTLVWYEVHDTMLSAIEKEKTLKDWNREWKIRLIEKENPSWKDLYEEIAW